MSAYCLRGFFYRQFRFMFVFFFCDNKSERVRVKKERLKEQPLYTSSLICNVHNTNILVNDVSDRWLIHTHTCIRRSRICYGFAFDSLASTKSLWEIRDGSCVYVAPVDVDEYAAHRIVSRWPSRWTVLWLTIVGISVESTNLVYFVRIR